MGIFLSVCVWTSLKTSGVFKATTFSQITLCSWEPEFRRPCMYLLAPAFWSGLFFRDRVHRQCRQSTCYSSDISPLWKSDSRQQNALHSAAQAWCPRGTLSSFFFPAPQILFSIKFWWFWQGSISFSPSFIYKHVRRAFHRKGSFLFVPFNPPHSWGFRSRHPRAGQVMWWEKRAMGGDGLQLICQAGCWLTF